MRRQQEQVGRFLMSIEVEDMRRKERFGKKWVDCARGEQEAGLTENEAHEIIEVIHQKH